MLRSFAAAAMGAAVLSVTGCAGGSTVPEPVVTRPSASPAVTATSAPTPTIVKDATWGDTITLPTGLAFTVAYVGVRPATQYTQSGKFSGKTAVFKTTLVNGTRQPVSTSQWADFPPILTAGADGHQAAGNSWDGSAALPQARTLASGETTTWEWGVDDTTANTKALRVEYSVPAPLGGGANPVVWRGDVP